MAAKRIKYWATEKPTQVIETSLHPEKIGVWVGITRKKIYGPIFFTDTVTSKEYIKIIDQFIETIDEEILIDGYFQQDAAPAHTSRETAYHSRTYFHDRIIGKSNKYLETEIDYPPRSPHLTSPDFFLWGYLKYKVYLNNPKSIDELKTNIETEIKNITPKMLENVSNNMLKRVKLCIENGGKHFEQLL